MIRNWRYCGEQESVEGLFISKGQFIMLTMQNSEKLAVLCYNADKLTKELFFSCGVSENFYSRCIIRGVSKENEFSNIVKDQGHYNISKARAELVSISEDIISENKDVGAFLIECTDMPAHAAAIQKAVNLPVFDPTIMLKFLHGVVNC